MNDRPDPLPELLADHDAGLPVDPSVLTDPRARGVLDALAATRAQLAAVPRDPVPPEVADRWNAALAQAARTGAPRPGTGPGTRDDQARPQQSDARSLASGPLSPAAGPGVAVPDAAVLPGPDPAGPTGAGGRGPTAGPVVPEHPTDRAATGTDGPAGGDGPSVTADPVAPVGPTDQLATGTDSPAAADSRNPATSPAAPEHPTDRAATGTEGPAGDNGPAAPVHRAGRSTTGTARPATADDHNPTTARPTTGTDGRSPTVGPASPPRPAGRPGAGPPRRVPGGRSPAPDRPAGPHRRGRGRLPRPAVLAGLVLVVVLVVAGVAGLRPDPPSVSAAQLGGIARAAVGVQEAGPLSDPIRREACLRAVAPAGLAPDAPLAGGRSVTFEGHPGVLLLLTTGRLATFRVVVVTPTCDALLADAVVGP